MSTNKPTDSCYARTPLLYYVAIQIVIVNVSALFLTMITVNCMHVSYPDQESTIVEI